MLSSVLMLALEQSQAKDLESESLEFLFVPFSAKNCVASFETVVISS